MNPLAQLMTYFFGPCFILICISFILYGITLVQAYVYWVKFPLDSKWIRCTVLIVSTIESVHTAVCVMIMYNYVNAELENLLAVAEIDWTAGTSTLLTAVLIFIVETFFVRRIWIMSNGKIFITVIAAIFVVLQAGCNLVNSILLFKGGEWETYRSEELTSVTTILSLSLAVVTELMITLVLIFYLRKSRSGFHGMNHHIAKAQIYLVNSGALTVAVAMSILLAFLLSKNTLLYGGLGQLLCKFYTNAFLAMLNVRNCNSTYEEAFSDDYMCNSTVLSTVVFNDVQRPTEIFQRIGRHCESMP